MLLILCSPNGLAQSTYSIVTGDLGAARAARVEQIRAEMRKKAPAADDAYFESTLAALAHVDRERFVPRELVAQAYQPTSLAIGYNQTITDASVVALMTAAARLPHNANVLDVGTGSGYQAAVLSHLSHRVSSIEIVKPLAEDAAKRLRHLGYRNITVRNGDGYAGWPDRAPFDAIIVAAGAARVPQPLLDQLKTGGRLVMPIGPSWAQEQLLVIHKELDGRLEQCSLGWTMFVPLTGKGQRSPTSAGIFDTKVPLCFSASVVMPEFKPTAG